MRAALACVTLMGLTACGGGSGGSLWGGAGSVSHSCTHPAPSGSADQIACHKKAATICPEGTAPDRVDFYEKSPGEYVVKGYSCV